MQRRKKKSNEINGNGWMDTYADTITLLLTFFILLYSFSTTDNEKLKQIAKAFEGQILGRVVVAQDIDDSVGTVKPELGIKNDYDTLVKKINVILKQNGLSDEIKVREEDAGVVLQLKDSILFDSGEAQLRNNSEEILDVISSILPQIENEVMVQGHTDDVPISSSIYKSNWELSTARAVTVVKYFIEAKGLNPSRFSATGYGEYRPLVENSTKENKSTNRRVDILIVQKKEKVN